ncbi:MAG: amidohydrolase, partial [Thermoanaerobaculia bacterium]
EPKVVEWRRYFHQYPELGNREFETAKKVAKHLEELGMKVTTGVAHTGVVGVLEGGKPGPVVALRADMDGLPVTERNDLPFASKETTLYAGQEVGVMHACGHDTHIAILLGAAEVLAAKREELPGTVKFIFQPAEEGPPPGEEGGAELMEREGVLKSPDVEAAFALHIDSLLEVGHIGYRAGGIWASADDYKITIRGRQSHGAAPWMGVDPIVTSAQLVSALQTIVSRNLKLTDSAAVVTVGSIHGGVRSNIVPEQVELIGTIRALDPKVRLKIHERVRTLATQIAESMGATAEVQIPMTMAYPVTYNDPELTARMAPVLEEAAGAANVHVIAAETGAEDFSFFARKVPGLYFTLGGRPADTPVEEAADHHTPDFYLDDSRLGVGVRAMVGVTLAYLSGE